MFDFLSVDEVNKTILINQPNINIDKNIIIPKGYKLVCGPGTELNLSNSAKIISFSALEFDGTEQQPIIIRSADSTGQGIAVINAAQPSVLKYTRFENLSNPSQSGWKLRGAVTFYESDIKISHCQFANNNSEDALNIVRANFEIIDTIFIGTQSDAFDTDFSNGTIKRSSFVNCGNDAIDISGSTVQISDIYVENAGDKAISAGEKSDMNASHITISNTEIAVASKDMSKIFMDDISITNCKIGFACYQKKPEFGFALINVKNLKMNNTKIPYLIEQNSKMVVEGKQIPAVEKNVKDILYGQQYGKASSK